jgi:hypothetical protein
MHAYPVLKSKVDAELIICEIDFHYELDGQQKEKEENCQVFHFVLEWVVRGEDIMRYLEVREHDEEGKEVQNDNEVVSILQMLPLSVQEGMHCLVL